MTISKKKLLLSVILLDNLGASIVLPVFTMLFFHANTALSINFEGASFSLLSITLMLYPAAILLCSPVIGRITDMVNPKLPLLICCLFSSFGYMIIGFSIIQNNLIILLIGRFSTGIGACSLLVCRASLIKESDVKNYGVIALINGVASVGFVIGPLLGGLFSSVHYSYPFWVLSFLYSFLIVFISFSHFTNITRNQSDVSKGSLRTIVYNLLVYFLVALSWNIFFQYFSLFLFNKFNFLHIENGATLSYISLCFIMAMYFSSKFESLLTFIKCYSSWVCVLLFVSLLVVYTANKLAYIVIPLTLLCLIFPILSAIEISEMSRSTNKSGQGKIMGYVSTTNSAAWLLAPGIGVFLSWFNISYYEFNILLVSLIFVLFVINKLCFK